MKVIMCHNFYKLAGGEDQVFRDECWLLEKHGHVVIQLVANNDEISALSRMELIKKTFWNSETYRNVRELIQSHSPDVVHCANTFPLISPSLYFAAAAERVPVVQTLHNFRLFCPSGYLLRNNLPCESCLGKQFAFPAVIYKCYRDSRLATAVSAAMHSYHRIRGTWHEKVGQYIALTEFSKQKFIQAGLPADRISVKPNFVHPDPGFSDQKEDYAIFVGRLSSEKGVQVLLDAWETLAARIPLKIVGDGPMADFISDRISRLPNVQWLGQQPFENVLHLIRSAKMLVFPSIWYETFGRAIIEAKAAGTPVIASNLGAMAELNMDRETGLLFEPGNSNDLVAKVELLIRDHELRERIGRQGREQFDRQFTAERNIRDLLHVYRKAGVNVPEDSFVYK